LVRGREISLRSIPGFPAIDLQFTLKRHNKEFMTHNVERDRRDIGVIPGLTEMISQRRNAESIRKRKRSPNGET
jgi:hypothetical protein